MSNTNVPTAVLITRTFKGLDIPSFQLVPINKNAPFICATFDPAQLMMVCLTDLTYDSEKRLPKLANNGAQIPIRTNGVAGHQIERVISRDAHENYIDGKENILQYVEAVCGTTKFHDGTLLADLLDKHIKRVQGEVVENKKKVAAKKAPAAKK